MAANEDVYSWLLSSADQMPYPALEPNPLDAESIGVPIDTDDSLLARQPLPLSLPLNTSDEGGGNFLHGSSVGMHGNNGSSSQSAALPTNTGNDGHESNKASGTMTGKKRASSSSTKNDKAAKKLKQSREDVLERNRRSARECRERKKERVGQLEARVRRLEQENMQLRVQLRIGRETDESETAEKWRITNLLGDMIKENKSDASIEETITMFTERYADYGKERRVACRYHLDYLEKLLVPTQVTKMGLWTLDQEDDFYQDGSATSMSGAAENSIWHILCRECDVTEEQKSRIVSHRGRIRSLCGDLKASLELLSSLRNKVDGKNEELEGEMKVLRGILTPTQAAKFILWVSHNPACMQMLNKLWAKMDKDGSSQFLPSTSGGGRGGGSSSSSSGSTSSSDATGSPREISSSDTKHKE